MKSIKEQLDGALSEVIAKIDSQVITCEDFDKFISVAIIGETSPESVRDRLRRRTIVDPLETHRDNETGHQPMSQPDMAKRVQPKIKPEHQQNHGRSKNAHRASVRTQARNRKLDESIKFINDNVDKTITESMIESINDKKIVKKIVNKMLLVGHKNGDWLYSLIRKLES